MVVVLKPKIKRSGGLEVALDKARFDSAVCLRRWKWSGTMRCGYAPVRTNANAALRCARGREACRGQLGKVEFGRLKAASDARLPWEVVKRRYQAESVCLSTTACLGFGL
jgi:hypothetical protein